MSTNKSVPVSSADSFIGSHLTEDLVRDNCNIKAFTRVNAFDSWGWLDPCSKNVNGNFEVVAYDQFRYQKLLRKIEMIFNFNFGLISE